MNTRERVRAMQDADIHRKLSAIFQKMAEDHAAKAGAIERKVREAARAS